ncbi:MAG: hypothetical protein NT167_11545, partial [Verrucomicrobia bacterium]|nr:hypothetical protein [Verrucomicrobiota bacterium]
IYECRKELRTAQKKKAGAGSGFFKKMLSSAGSSPLMAKAHMELAKNPAEALKIAEQILNGEPTSSGAHKLVVEAATALELPRTAVLSLEILAANSPKDRDIAVKFANALADSGEVGRAEKVLADLYRSFPTDNDLAQALKDLSARKTLNEGGYDALADGRAADQRIRGAPQDRAEEPEAAAFVGGVMHAEEAVRPRPGILRANQDLGGRRRRFTGSQHCGHDGAEIGL